MIKLVEISKEQQLLEGIAIGFFDDTDLIEKYHNKGISYYDSVNDTLGNILECSVLYSMQWYEIWVGEAKVGYTVLSRPYNFLYSFAINKSYRIPYLLSEWFEEVSVLLQNNFVCTLWSKNKRAIDFLITNGMTISENNETTMVLTKYN